jgi:hypothetical protein
MEVKAFNPNERNAPMIGSTDSEDRISLNGKHVGFDDYIKVLPSGPKKRDGFVGKVRGWWITDEGVIDAIDVWGGRVQHERMRSIRPSQVQVLSARAQKKMQQADEDRRSKKTSS